MTKVQLQIIPKNNIDICVVNAVERSLGDYHLFGDIGDTYCRIMHTGRIYDEENNISSRTISELTSRMNNQVVPLLKDATCAEFFALRDEAEIRQTYPDYANQNIYTVSVELVGCPEDNGRNHNSEF